ncbi:MAG: DNA primase [Acidobacteria bacterium]|nr:DNA primase [Acidobacteriota bacterium]
MSDRDLVQRVKDATDLVALVGQAVKLRKQGSAFVGLCPFHSERTPSFQVVPARQFWHCFGCGRHGDALSWLQEREGLTFREALEQLARSAGIEVPAFRERPREEVDREDRLRAVLEAAQGFYARRLRDAPKACSYLQSRGISEAFIQEAGFGYAPDAWEDLVGQLRQHGMSPDLAEQAGLAFRTERGTLVDFLRDRLTIPIHDLRGRIVGFGGRALGDAKPKYLNTRETPLFKKSELLFGLHRAKGTLKEGAVVVEGYFDVLQLHQLGLPQAVAPLGTALTDEHLRLLARFTKRLVLCFDGDPAGRNAMEKALRAALPQAFEVRLLELPPGEDPDTWCLKVGAQAFREIVAQAPDWTGFMVDRALEGRDLRRVSDRMAAFRQLLPFLAFLPEGPARGELFGALAHQLQMPAHEIHRAVREQGGGQAEALAPGPPPLPEVDERLRPVILACREAQSCREVAAWPPAWWESLAGAPLLQALLDAEGDMETLPAGALGSLRHLEARLAVRDDQPSGRPLPHLGSQLEEDFVLREIQALQRQLRDPATTADPAMARQVESRLTGLLARKGALQRSRRTRGIQEQG